VLHEQGVNDAVTHQRKTIDVFLGHREVQAAILYRVIQCVGNGLAGNKREYQCLSPTPVSGLFDGALDERVQRLRALCGDPNARCRIS
jgi:hypothetical protein